MKLYLFTRGSALEENRVVTFSPLLVLIVKVSLSLLLKRALPLTLTCYTQEIFPVFLRRKNVAPASHDPFT